MKICWENLEKVRLRGGNFYSGNIPLFYIEECTVCKESFLTKKFGLFCSRECEHEKERPLCKCGCGKYTTWHKIKLKWNEFLHGHQFKGKKHKEESIKKQSESKKGKKHSEEHNKKIGLSGIGRVQSEETRKKRSESLKKHNYAPERIEKLKLIGRETSLKRRGYHHTEESKKKMSESQKGKIGMAGEDNPNWRGGVSFLPYPIIWDNKLRNEIKTRDDFKCQNPECYCNAKRLNVHHIDYDKQNCSEFNLITLCVGCNSRANYNREYWQGLYQWMISEKYFEFFSCTCS